MFLRYISGWVKAGSSPSLMAEAAIAEHVDHDRLGNFCRYSVAILAAKTTASGSSPFTWKIGASTIFATSDG